MTTTPPPTLFRSIPANDGATRRIKVYDGTGRTVKAPIQVAGTRPVSMDLGDVAPGAYYLMATRDGQQRAMKRMVKR